MGNGLNLRNIKPKRIRFYLEFKCAVKGCGKPFWIKKTTYKKMKRNGKEIKTCCSECSVIYNSQNYINNIKKTKNTIKIQKITEKPITIET